MTDSERTILMRMILEELEKQSKHGTSDNYKKVLAVFSGGWIGLDCVLDQMKQLQSEHYQFEVVWTPNGKTVIGESRIKNVIGNIPFHDDSSLNTALELFDGKDMLIIPVLTLNTAAKIVNGIADNLATFLIMLCLLSGKSILAVCDACNLQHIQREQMGHTQATRAYSSMLASNIECLKDYGVTLCQGNELYEKLKLISKHKGVPDLFFDKRVLCVSDLPGPGERINIANDTIVTPAAQDVAHERGIQIVTYEKSARL